MRKNVKVSIIGLIILAFIIIVLVRVENISNKFTNTSTQQTKSVDSNKNEEVIQIYDLLACPFCNGYAVLLPVNYSFYIRCEDCGLETSFFNSEEEAVDYWNIRAY